MSLIEHAVIAAAGLGSRLGHGLPKCLIEVAGRTILEWQLSLLEEVPDVRLVVGFKEHEVVERAFSIRTDITIVRNPAYRVTTTQQSYWLGARYLSSASLFLDGDIIFDPASFRQFLLRAADQSPLVGITAAKTQHAVYASVVEESTLRVTGFSREVRSEWEWANIACLKPGMLEENGRDVYTTLARFTPLPAQPVTCYEVDTTSDLAQAEDYVTRWNPRPVLRVA